VSKPAFSIITCTWNSAATLADTLASVAAQTCRDVEHIFVDAGSTDATLALIAAYGGNKRVLRGVQGGISRAMNAGILAARGEVIAHLHSDDYYADDTVLQAVADRFTDGAVDWVYGNIQVLKDGMLLPPQAARPFSYRSLAAGKAFIPHPAVFVRRAAFERAGLFDEGLRYAMDIDLWLRLGAISRPARLDRTLAVFRDHAGSLSSANKLKARQEEFRVRCRHMRKAPLAFSVYCLRYLKRMRQLRREAAQTNC
jgi:glycosyltransferase involved in cell wall biosynthesis